MLSPRSIGEIKQPVHETQHRLSLLQHAASLK